MRPLVDWLLNLEGVSLDGELRLRFDSAPAPWLSAVIVGVLIAYVVVIYRKEGIRRRRWFLASLRVLAVLLVLGLIFQPVLVVERTRLNKSVVIVLADHSASMDVRDRFTHSDDAERALASGTTTRPAGGRTRRDVANALLEHPAWGDLLARNDLQLFRVGGSADALPRAATPEAWDEVVTAFQTTTQPAGSTQLLYALRSAVDELRDRRIAGVVVLSDGRDTANATAEDAADAAVRAGAKIFPALVGSPEPPRDVWLSTPRLDPDAYLKDVLAVAATVSARGLEQPTQITVRLLDEDSGAELSREEVTVGGALQDVPAELRFRPTRAGEARLLLTAETLPDEIDDSNNRQIASVQVHDDQIRVLYLEDLPRWQYRFLKTQFARESTLSTSLWLQSAVGSGFVQEGSDPIRALPDSEPLLFAYDVVIIGDIDPARTLSPNQMELLTRFVSERGGGLAFIAGPVHGPGRIRGTPLERLLPVQPDPGLTTDSGLYTVAYRPQITTEGQASPLLRFEIDPERNQEAWERLPALYWFARVLGAKPAAEVILQHPEIATAQGPIPLLVTSRFGAGRTAYIGTDETWRWRQGVGEAYFEALWLQLVRSLVRDRLLNQTRDAVLTVARSTVDLGEPVDVLLEVLNPDLLASVRDRVTVNVLTPAGDPVSSLELIRSAEGGKQFRGSLPPLERVGQYLIEWPQGGTREAAAPPSTRLQVQLPDLERRDRSTDFALLRQLAEKTEGEALYPAEFGRLAALIGDRATLEDASVTRELWDARLALVLIVLLLTTEWIVRKLSGMV